MIDQALSLDQDDECVLCGELFLDYSLVSVTPGELQIGEKSGRLQFRADSYPVNYFHLHCFLERCNSYNFALNFHRQSVATCGICGDNLEHEQLVFRLTEGFIHGEKFQPVLTQERTILCVELCLECILSHLGEGDTEMGAMYLGIDLDEC